MKHLKLTSTQHPTFVPWILMGSVFGLAMIGMLNRLPFDSTVEYIFLFVFTFVSVGSLVQALRQLRDVTPDPDSDVDTGATGPGDPGVIRLEKENDKDYGKRVEESRVRGWNA